MLLGRFNDSSGFQACLCVHTNVLMRMCMCVPMCMHVHMRVCLHMCICVYENVYVFAHAYVCAYYIHICMSVDI